MNANLTTVLFSRLSNGSELKPVVYFWDKDNNRTKTNLYDPYAMGYRRATKAKTIRGEIVKSSYSLTFAQYELLPETRQHEDGILSNRE